MSGDPVQANVTSYHPDGSLATMEGGPKDRYGRMLVTVEQAMETGAEYSVAADYQAMWYRKDRKVRIDGIPGIGRLCDTGGHFYGPGKVWRHPGVEPFDVCVARGGVYAGINSIRSLEWMD